MINFCKLVLLSKLYDPVNLRVKFLELSNIYTYLIVTHVLPWLFMISLVYIILIIRLLFGWLHLRVLFTRGYIIQSTYRSFDRSFSQILTE